LFSASDEQVENYTCPSGEAALAAPFSPERFNQQEEVTSYLGLVHVVRQSGSWPA